MLRQFKSSVCASVCSVWFLVQLAVCRMLTEQYSALLVKYNIASCGIYWYNCCASVWSICDMNCSAVRFTDLTIDFKVFLRM